MLEPIDDDSLKIELPINTNFIKELISKEEVEQLINKIPYINTVEHEYKRLLSTGNKELITIIKITYLRNKERIDNKKKLSDKDSNYFNKTERILYNEFSVVLGMTYEETKNYIINKVNKMEK